MVKEHTNRSTPKSNPSDYIESSLDYDAPVGRRNTNSSLTTKVIWAVIIIATIAITVWGFGLSSDSATPQPASNTANPSGFVDNGSCPATSHNGYQVSCQDNYSHTENASPVN